MKQPGRFAAMGRGFSGHTDDIDEARGWASKDIDGLGTVYVRVEVAGQATYDRFGRPLPEIEKTVACTKCGHPVWFIAGENDPHPCTDCGEMNARSLPSILDVPLRECDCGDAEECDCPPH